MLGVAGVPSLLESIGGHDAIEIVVVGLWERIQADPRLAAAFADVSRLAYERSLARYLGALLDEDAAPWDGRDLRGVHARLAIAPDDFGRFVDCLAATLDAAGVSPTLRDAVRARVETVRELIVERSRAPGSS